VKTEPPPLRIGDRARVRLSSKNWRSAGWFEGTVVRVDAYSSWHSYYRVELDTKVETTMGGKMHMISVFNPKHIEKI
jgi:hypothetical protein